MSCQPEEGEWISLYPNESRTILILFIHLKSGDRKIMNIVVIKLDGNPSKNMTDLCSGKTYCVVCRTVLRYYAQKGPITRQWYNNEWIIIFTIILKSTTIKTFHPYLIFYFHYPLTFIQKCVPSKRTWKEWMKNKACQQNEGPIR